MTLLQNTVAYFYLILCFLSSCSFAFPVPTEAVADVLKLNNFSCIMMVLLQPLDSDPNNGDSNGDDNNGQTKYRVKRDGAGKFSDSAKMSPIKVLQLYLQMFRNLVSTVPIGGVNPLSISSVKPVVKLFKHRIIGVFFPDVGDDKVQN